MNIVQRSVLIGWSMLCLLFALMAYIELGLVGFPDGHRSSYEQDTYGLRQILLGLCIVQVLYFLYLGAGGRYVSVAGLGVRMAVAAVFVIAPMLIVTRCSRIAACTQAYELILQKPMDDGAGG